SPHYRTYGSECSVSPAGFVRDSTDAGAGQSRLAFGSSTRSIKKDSVQGSRGIYRSPVWSLSNPAKSGGRAMPILASEQPGLVSSSEAMRFFPVEVSTIQDGILEMDVYLDAGGDGSSYVLYCAEGVAFTSKLRE